MSWCRVRATWEYACWFVQRKMSWRDMARREMARREMSRRQWEGRERSTGWEVTWSSSWNRQAMRIGVVLVRIMTRLKWIHWHRTSRGHQGNECDWNERFHSESERVSKSTSEGWPYSVPKRLRWIWLLGNQQKRTTTSLIYVRMPTFTVSYVTNLDVLIIHTHSTTHKTIGPIVAWNIVNGGMWSQSWLGWGRNTMEGAHYLFKSIAGRVLRVKAETIVLHSKWWCTSTTWGLGNIWRVKALPGHIQINCQIEEVATGFWLLASNFQLPAYLHARIGRSVHW